MKPGHQAVLLIGERDDGNIQGVTNPDNIQKSIRRCAEEIYPPILWRSMVYEKENKCCVRVEVEYDGETPHFGGPAWVRKGSESIIATDIIFQRLIDLRSGIVFKLENWLNKEVSVHGDSSTIPNRDSGINKSLWLPLMHRWKPDETVKIVFVNGFWVTFEKLENGEKVSEPLRKITLSYDDKQNRTQGDY